MGGGPAGAGPSGPALSRTAGPAGLPRPEPPAGRGAWAVGRAKLRETVTTEPGRLRILGAVLAGLVLAFGVLAALEADGRASAAANVVGRSQPLSADAARIFRSLADADTAATSAFLAGAPEPATTRQRYERDIATAARLLAKASGHTGDSPASAREIEVLNERLPVYTGRVETARSINRQGLPLGGAYLRYANQQMTTELLPAAQRLYDAESGRLDRDTADARSWPYAALVLGLLALGALGWAQRRVFLRTNRVFNHGLLAGSAAVLAGLLWLVAGYALAAGRLGEARTGGQESLAVLNQARISSLRARAAENLVLVAGGAVLTDERPGEDREDKYERDYRLNRDALLATLGRAARLADDPAGREPVTRALEQADQWKKRHTEARRLDNDRGDYESALALVIGTRESTSGSTGELFDQVDRALDLAVHHEQGEFTRAAEGASAALTGLPVGAAVLAGLGAVGALMGINRRLTEYR
ncbi:hypothetical protein NX801_23590 [Streptomyces sp. LP05-1]|uniref:Secreted protein n=1 Tax=Streptomyces pyxinae TaxID=2970734 RepID=A0ABT2CME4_9ACTN|nr:hypothetical protein [Streptomyces sp. LP05-1]MCS0638587.1 hypothetical protein [Streptomyces sp. LP05-1]